jgi:hypothetical protein
MELKDLKFTRDEFDMLIKGIEGLPHQDQAGELMGELIGSMLSDKMPQEMKIARERDIAKKKQTKDMERAHLKENCCILQSKLIQLRRYMESNDMIMEAQDIINNTER